MTDVSTHRLENWDPEKLENPQKGMIELIFQHGPAWVAGQFHLELHRLASDPNAMIHYGTLAHLACLFKGNPLHNYIDRLDAKAKALGPPNYDPHIGSYGDEPEDEDFFADEPEDE